MRHDPTLPDPTPQRDHDNDRKARLEDGDRRASNARLARHILREFWVEGTPEQKRESMIAELVASGPFSAIEAGEALDECDREDAANDAARFDEVRFRARANGMLQKGHEWARACASISHPSTEEDTAWGLRQLGRIAKEMQEDVAELREMFLGASARRPAENHPSPSPSAALRAFNPPIAAHGNPMKR